MKIKITVYETDNPFTDDKYIVENYDSRRNVSTTYYGIKPDEAAVTPIKAVYTDNDAMRWAWQRTWDALGDTQHKAILAVFPNLLKRDAATLKAAGLIWNIAREKIRAEFGETCPYCNGTGGAKSGAIVFDDRALYACYKCKGTGKQLPKLTAKKLAEIKAFFGGAK